MLIHIAWGAAVLVVGVVAWLLGARSGGGDHVRRTLEGLAAELGGGRRPSVGPGAPEGMTAVREALDRQWSGKNEEREQALKEALGRIAAFLREGVEGPLRGAVGGDPKTLRHGVDDALGALEDLGFFLREPLTPDETHDLGPVVQQVTREFTQDWNIAVRLRAESRPIRAHIHKGSFMDALYLLLHNSGQFGGGETVDVTLSSVEGQAVVAIRDRGPGFTDEALERAQDLFFSTTESGLGLGIPFAKKIVESFGGSMEVRNADGGGAEVRLLLPED